MAKVVPKAFASYPQRAARRNGIRLDGSGAVHDAERPTLGAGISACRLTDVTRVRTGEHGREALHYEGDTDSK
jgi:hypothetical protein